MRSLVLRYLGPASFLILLGIYLFSRNQFNPSSLPTIIASSPNPGHSAAQDACPFALSSFDFKDDLISKRYSRGVLRPRFVRTAQPSLTRIDKPVLTDFGTVESELLKTHPGAQDDCSNTSIATIDVAYDSPAAHTEKLLLGMTTPLGRLEMRLSEISYYLLSSKVALLVVVPGEGDLAQEERRFRDMGLDITLVPSTVEPFQLRYFSMMRELSLHIAKNRPDTHWVATIDDDTFFPRIKDLGTHLSTLDHTKFHWVGTLSESSLNVKNFGYFSYGGSGIFLSRALLGHIDSHYENCTGEDLGRPTLGGDHRITKCINRLLPHGFNLTVENRLRQWDLRGAPAGLFESGRTIWTFHHWGQTGWFNKDVLSISATSTIAGEGSILQRFMFNRQGGSDINAKRSYYVLTNGFSVVKYDLEPGVEDIDFDRTEYTWNDNPVDYEDFVGPFREVDIPGITKKRWLLESVKRVGSNIHQMYTYRENGENDIIEFVWISP